MEVKIGVQHSPRELVIDSPKTPDEIAAEVSQAMTGSKDEALKAFALHPLVDSVSVARDLVSGYVAKIPEVAAVLTK